MTDVVAAVVTAFHPGDRMLELVRSLTPQVSRVVVVDDGSGPGADGVLEAARAAGAEVVRHDTNRGIAAALNTGLAAARRGGGSGDEGSDDGDSTSSDSGSGSGSSGNNSSNAPDFVLTFDQDSQVAADFVASLVATAADARAAGLKVGAVAPGHVEGLPSPVIGYSRGFMLGGTPIQSGLLIAVRTLDTIGGFREQLFIDGVDTDFALRAQDAALLVLIDGAARLGHSLGRRHTPALFGRPLEIGGQPISLVYSATFRYYFLTRNRVLLNRLHGRRHRGWTVTETLADLRHLLIVLALVPGRAGRLRMIAAGLADGWAGRGGPLPARLRNRATAG